MHYSCMAIGNPNLKNSRGDVNFDPSLKVMVISNLIWVR